MSDAPTWDEIDLLVDTDPLALRDLAWSLRERLVVAERERDRLVEALRSAKREHYYGDDCWFSCPKSRDGCCDESQGDACNCGADEANAAIDAVLAECSQPPWRPVKGSASDA